MAATIKKAKLRDGQLEAEYYESHKRGGKSIKAECAAPVHEDMITAFRQLDLHVAVLCEQVDAKAILNVEPDSDMARMLYKITCTGFTIGGSDEHEGVTLIGRRELNNNRVLNLVTPFTKWEDENAPYQFGDELLISVGKCIGEVDAYLFAGKYAPDPQGELFAVEELEEVGA